MKADATIVTLLWCLVAVVLVSLLSGNSAETRSYEWAKTFCGGKDTDISQYHYYAKGHVQCKDGRIADVPL